MWSKGCHDTHFVVSGCTVGCHNENLHQWRQNLHLVIAPHYTTFKPTSYFAMTSILLRLIVMSLNNSTENVAGMASNISTSDEATTIRISPSSADMMPKCPEWLQWFKRSGDLTRITMLSDHNLTVLPPRSFALWPETQVRKDLSKFGSFDWLCLTEIRVRIGNHIHSFLCGVITNDGHKFSCRLANFNLGHGWVTKSHTFVHSSLT